MVTRVWGASLRQAGRAALQTDNLRQSLLEGWLSCIDSGNGACRGAWAALQQRCFAKKRQHKKRKKPTLHGPSTWPKSDRERWHKDLALDLVVEKERSTLHVLAMKDILANLPGMQMPMAKLASYKRFIGLVGDRSRPAAWLDKHPSMFEVHDKATAHSWFTFTSEAAENVAKEKQFWAENEGLLVDKVRKILMMAPDRRLSLDVLAQLKRPIGLPDDFKDNLVFNYPQYFRVVEAKHGAELELTEWDPELAVSYFEKMLATRPPRPAEEETRSGPAKNGSSDPWVYWSSFRNKANLRKKHVQEIIEFHQDALVSPYFDRWQELEAQSVEAERHAVAVLHELMSLTLRKRVVIDHLAHYRKFFRHTKPTRSIFIKHPELFYVSLKSNTETVFLRDAYSSCELVVQDPFLQAQSWVTTMNESRMFAKKIEKERLKELRRNQNKAAREQLAGQVKTEGGEGVGGGEVRETSETADSSEEEEGYSANDDEDVSYDDDEDEDEDDSDDENEDDIGEGGRGRS